MSYIPRNFNETEIQRLGTLISDGVRCTDEIKALQEGLRETIKSVAEELEIKPAIINKAIKAAYDRNYDAIENDVSLLEEILRATKNR